MHGNIRNTVMEGLKGTDHTDDMEDIQTPLVCLKKICAQRRGVRTLALFAMILLSAKLLQQCPLTGV